MKAPPDIRPTSALVREAIVNMLRDELVDAVVVDLFAGSGALGFEALSAGAKDVTFVESNPRTLRFLKENIRQLDDSLAEKCHVRRARAEYFSLGELSPADVIIADPPYDLVPKVLEPLADNVASSLAVDGLFLFEFRTSDSKFVGEHFAARPCWSILRSRAYGDTSILLLRKLGS